MKNIAASAPFFSVVLPVYNGQDFIAGAVDSVLAQSEPGWELIIVDDHSGDRTPQILAEYAARDKRVRVFTNPQNYKIARSLNRGIEAARAEWIVRLDADDAFKPDYLKTLRTWVENPESRDCFFSACVTVVDETGNKVLDVLLPDAETIRRMMPIENFLYHPATSFTKSLWEKAGKYPVADSAIAEDTALWTRFFELDAKLVMIPQCLVNYRIHYQNTTSINDARLLAHASPTDRKSIRQNREWRISLFLKQKMLKLARSEILGLARMQKYLSPKNLHYFLLTFLPAQFVYEFMWELRPRLRAFLKNLRGRSIRI